MGPFLIHFSTTSGMTSGPVGKQRTRRDSNRDLHLTFSNHIGNGYKKGRRVGLGDVVSVF